MILDIVLSIFLAVAAAVIFALTRRCLASEREKSLLAERNAALSERVAALSERNATLSERIAELTALTAKLEKESAEGAEKMRAEHERRIAESEQHFKLIASQILDENSRKFKEQNETRLAEILLPLKENLDSFRKTVTDAYNNESRQRFSLEERIKEMIELNRTIGREAKDLAVALRGNSKIQGDWGEMILETILDKSGLKRDVHYRVQQTVDDDGNALRDAAGNLLRPDVVIYYPDGRCIVIDSKVSLTAYVNLANADDDSSATAYGMQHIASIKSHIKELAEKKYQDYLGDRKTDFVMMFIPNEAAYMAAMNLEPTLWQQAYDKRVIIISPTHLISAIRLVEQLWRQDDIKRNVIDIATESGKMYDKFVGFVEDMARIEKALDSSRSAYDSAMKKLQTGTGNLIGRARKIREMGAKASKNLPSTLVGDEEE